MDVMALILAAGKGTRMKSKINKNLHLLSGQPIVTHVIDAAVEAGVGDIALVIGHDADRVRSTLGEQYQYVYQREQLGTGHAVMQAEELLRSNPDSTVLIMLGDSPLITARTLRRLIDTQQQNQAAAALLVDTVEDPTGMGRVLRNSSGAVVGVVEESDANEEQKRIKEVWTGFSCFRAADLLESLACINNDNAQGEYYITDTIKVLTEQGKLVVSSQVLTANETMNINDRCRLAEAEQLLQQRIQTRLMESGVTIVSPANTYIEKRVRVGQDTVILPFTCLRGSTSIGSNCVIGPYTHVENSCIGDEVVLERSTAKQVQIDTGAVVGPFAYLRPNTHLQSKSKAGSFVEIKNSIVGQGSKVPHLSYVGDTDIGHDVNLGAGTIVVNYDGRYKHRSRIRDRAFVGCNANLVSPVDIGEEAYVAAGSTITEDVPAGALAIARERQINKQGWVAKKRLEWENREDKE